MPEEDESPFRAVAYLDRDGAIEAQMVGALKFIMEWKRWGAVIAGGALWSWAAGNPANDVDIFTLDTWWSRWRCHKLFGKSTAERAVAADNAIGSYAIARGRGLHVFRTFLTNHPSTKVDMVLASQVKSKTDQYRPNPTLASGLFDYGHCLVAYGLDWSTLEGADFYRTGLLQKLISDARDPNFVMGKVQQSLWKAPDVRSKLEQVMTRLDEIKLKIK